MKPYQSIINEIINLNRQEQYIHLLKTIEWDIFRKKVFERDNETCTKCNQKIYDIEEIPTQEWLEKNQEIYLHNKEVKLREANISADEILERLMNGILSDYKPKLDKVNMRVVRTLEAHHKFYIWNKLPWEYSIESLTTLCDTCHRETHLRETIYTYSDASKKFRKVFPSCTKCMGTGYLPVYQHRDYGICYECWGAGIIYTDIPYWEEVR